MRIGVLSLLLVASSLAKASGPYEGSWFACLLQMEGRRNPWATRQIARDSNELKVVSEWGTKYSFSGSATPVGVHLVIRGCSYYVDAPMDGCDPQHPPIAERLQLPLNRTWPSDLDKALKRGDQILVRSPKEFDHLSKRCERLIEMRPGAKEQR